MNNSFLRRDHRSRAAMLLLSGGFLAAAAGLFYVGYVAWNSEGPRGQVPAHGFAGLPLFGMGVVVAWVGLFMLKRAVLPIHGEQDPPVIVFD